MWLPAGSSPFSVVLILNQWEKLLQYWLDILFGKLAPVVVEVSLMSTWTFVLQPRMASALAEEALLSSLCTDSPNQVWFS